MGELKDTMTEEAELKIEGLDSTVDMQMGWVELTSPGQGALFSPPDEKRAQSKLPATQAQKLGYAYNWQIWIENTPKFPKTVAIMSVSITEMIWQVKT